MPAKKPKPAGELSMADVLAAINEQHGAGTIMELGGSMRAPVEVIPSGSIALDEALGTGGFPRGRIVEVYGPESSGKTSVATHAAGNAQRMGLRVAFIDAEHAFDPEWARTLGADPDTLLLSQPDSGEQALQVAGALTRSGRVGLIIIDSVAALVPEAELKGEIGDNHVALMARMMSQALRMLTGPAASTGTCIIFINQLREKVGVFFGSSESQPGGKALKFYSSVRLDVRRIQTLKDKDVPIGSRVRVKVVKNKLGAPFRTAEFDFLFAEGISRAGELLDLGLERGVLRKSGAFYSAPGEDGETVTLGQGKEAARRYLAENPRCLQVVEAAVRGTVPPPAKAAPERALDMEGPAPWDGEAGP